MIFHVYGVYDKVAKRLAEPFIAVNDEVAIRMFNKSIEHWKKDNIQTEELTILHTGIYNTEMTENTEKGITISYENAFIGSNIAIEKMNYDVLNIRDINQIDDEKTLGMMSEMEVIKYIVRLANE